MHAVYWLTMIMIMIILILIIMIIIIMIIIVIMIIIIMIMIIIIIIIITHLVVRMYYSDVFWKPSATPRPWGVLRMQLRELVPAHPHSAAPQEGADSKRPKHVVLSDTIALVKELQGKVYTLPHPKGNVR